MDITATQARAALTREVDRIMGTKWAPRTRLEALQSHRNALAHCIAEDVVSGVKPYQPHVVAYQVAGAMLQERYEQMKQATGA